jgi:hypothetical protein
MVEYLNQFVPASARLRLLSWDMARCQKTKGANVLVRLEGIAASLMKVRKEVSLAVCVCVCVCLSVSVCVPFVHLPYPLEFDPSAHRVLSLSPPTAVQRTRGVIGRRARL